MAWVRFDDRFPSHRKIATLSDRAFRLYVSALCWSTENGTDGQVTERELRLIAPIRGVRRAAEELEEAGLWEVVPERDDDTNATAAVHDGCTTDARQRPDARTTTTRTRHEWRIHDFLQYQPSRAATEKKRQVRRDAGRRGGLRSGETRREKGEANASGSASPAREPRPVPSRKSSLPDGREQSPLTPHARPCAAPAWARELIDSLTAAGMCVRWQLTTVEWLQLQHCLQRIPAAHLVEAARRAWNPTSPPRTARYLLKVWSSLPDIPPGAPLAPEPTPARPRSTAEQRAAAALDLAAKFRAEEATTPSDPPLLQLEAAS